jgi:hypothetical protein
MKLRGVAFDWNRAEFPGRNFADRRQIGLVAQDVEQVFPELVGTDSQGYRSVEYDKLVPVLIEAIKTLKAQVDAQQREIDKLKAEHSPSP